MRRKFKVKVDDETFIVEVEEITEIGTIETTPDTKHAASAPRPVERKVEVTRGVVTAPLPGVISSIKKSVGDRVEVGNLLLVLEAMKMENEIFAPVSGIVSEIYINLGQQVGRGDKLMFIS
jgi:biotin carboxyl carrier protein